MFDNATKTGQNNFLLERLPCLKKVRVSNNLLVVTEMNKHVHKNQQDTLWNPIKRSVRFVTLDNVRKNEPKSFVKGKMAFFSKSLFLTTF